MPQYIKPFDERNPPSLVTIAKVADFFYTSKLLINKI
jgi:hypothetical protein